MAKVLRIAAVVVAIAAAIPSGGTSLLASGVAGAGIASGAAATAIASGLAVGLNLLTALTAKKPSIGGTQTSWRLDPDAPIPIIFGRTIASGDVRYRKQHGSKNKWDTFGSVLSGCGPIEAIDQTYLEKKPISFSGGLTGVHQIAGKDRIWQDVQLGACPEADALVPGVGSPPGWDSASKLSGYAAVMNTFQFDGKGSNTLTSTPQMNWLVRGVKCYDPRLDDTYPGGSGSCRRDDQDTWVFSENGWIQAITFALGWFQGPNAIRVGGVGMSFAAIDVPAFVEAANIADANGWKSGGRVTTADDKWEVLKSLCQAGGGEPVRYGAILSCYINAPRVSIGTISEGDLIGKGSSSTAQSIRDRVNAITPKYTSEDHFWEQVAAGTVSNATYLAQDRGRERVKQVAYPMVQCAAGETPDQAAQLAAYDMANAREAGPIVLPLKLRWLGYRVGDCLTIDPEATAMGWIAGKDVIVVKRQLDPTTGTVTLTLRTEDQDKHAWALSQAGIAAPTTSDPVIPTLDAPDAGDWSMAAGTGDVATLVISGALPDDDVNITGVDFAYRVDGSTAWVSATAAPPDTTGMEFTALESGVSYEGGVRYRDSSGASDWLILGPVTPVVAIIPPFELTATATDSDSVEVRYRQPRTLLLDYSHVLADETAVIGSAAQVGADQYGAGGDVVTITEDSIVAGPRSYWAVAFDDDGNDAAVGPVSINVGGFSFAGGSLPAGASLTRSGTGWYFNSSGALTSAATDVARFDHRWNGTAWVLAGLLVEPSRENRIRNSVLAGSTTGVIGSGGVMPTNGAFIGTATGITREVVGSGTEDGMGYVDLRISGTSSNGGFADIYFEAVTQSAAVTGDVFTASCFVKLAAGSLTGVDDIELTMLEYNSGPTVIATQEGAHFTPTSIRQRFKSTFTVGQATAAYTRMLLRVDTTGGATLDITLRVYQPQFEPGSGATSPILTNGAKDTRNADTLVLDWSTGRHVPDGAMTTRYGFDDASTQDVATTVASGTATVPTTLNRHAILSAQKIS